MDDIEKANAKLKAARAGIAIVRRGSKLSLRGMLPKKNGAGKAQQMIALDIYANPAGVKRAIAEAQKLSSLLALKEFDWSFYSSPAAVGGNKTIKQWLDEFEANYFSRRARTPQTETTWAKDYVSVFNQLPLSETLVPEVLRETILKSKPDTKSRKRYCTTIASLAKFSGIDFDPTPYRGNYSPKRVTPRQLPTDAEIAQWREKILDPSWQYTFGLMATYGLRNHEIFHLDLNSLTEAPGIATVLRGKTGERRIWPCYPEWWEKWKLWDVSLIPVSNAKNNTSFGKRVTENFKKYGFQKPYNLRHAWAVRSLEFGLDISLAAAQMGHSVKVHTEVYHYWITEKTHQRAFEALMSRSDRPLAP